MKWSTVAVVGGAIIVGTIGSMFFPQFMYNPANQYRDHIIEKNGPFATHVARQIAYENWGNLNTATLSRQLGDNILRHPDDREAVKDVIDDNQDRFHTMLDGILIGTISDFIGREIYHWSPSFEITETDIFMVHREFQEKVYEGRLELG